MAGHLQPTDHHLQPSDLSNHMQPQHMSNAIQPSNLSNNLHAHNLLHNIHSPNLSNNAVHPAHLSNVMHHPGMPNSLHHPNLAHSLHPSNLSNSVVQPSDLSTHLQVSQTMSNNIHPSNLQNSLHPTSSHLQHSSVPNHMHPPNTQNHLPSVSTVPNNLQPSNLSINTQPSDLSNSTQHTNSNNSMPTPELSNIVHPSDPSNDTQPSDLSTNTQSLDVSNDIKPPVIPKQSSDSEQTVRSSGSSINLRSSDSNHYRHGRTTRSSTLAEASTSARNQVVSDNGDEQPMDSNSTSNLGEILSKIITMAHQESIDKSVIVVERKQEKQCRSMGDLMSGKDNLLQMIPEEDVVICKACRKNNNTGSSVSTGVFPYNFNLGTSFKARRLPTDFRRLKFKIERHFKSVRHQKNVQKMGKPEVVVDKRSNTIAMRVLRTAYHVIKTSQAHKEFPNLINLQSLNGMNMGDINHSSGLISKLRDSFHDEILNGMKSKLTNPELANDVNLLADLAYARYSNSIPTTAKLMVESHGRLKKHKVLQPDIELTQTCCENVCHTLKEYKPYQNNISVNELFKFAWEKSAADVKEYMRIVVRLWLINPNESTVEPLATVLKDVFGKHRNLDQENAAKELVIKWNGPALHLADSLLEAVQRKVQLRFNRLTDRGHTKQSTVLSHYDQQ